MQATPYADHDLAIVNHAPLAPPLAAGRTELVFITSDVPDLALLLGGIGAGREVHVLDAQRDGLVQIADILAGREGIDAVHLVSHGAPGTLALGSSVLDQAALAGHSDLVQALGSALTPDGDLLLYGCNVGAGSTGQAFVDDLALRSGADVAASSNLTGAAALGGDWDLEVRSGGIETAALVGRDVAARYLQTLAIASATVSFTHSTGRFVSSGSTAGAGSDVIYNVAGNAAYQLKVDGATQPVYTYSNPGTYILGDAGSSGNESSVTFSFVGSQTFTADSIKLNSYAPINQTLNIQGFDASGNAVGTLQTVSLAGGSSGQAFTTKSLTGAGFTNIASLKITAAAGSNAGKLKYFAIDDLAMSNIQSADTTPPTIAISSDKSTLKAGETAAITFTLSEASTSFIAGDVTVSGGTLTGFTGSGTSYSATFTPTAGSSTSGVVSVASTKFTDAAGNNNVDGADANNTVTMTVNTVLPTIAIASDKTALKVGETATLTFTLSEAATDFIAGEVTVSGGTLTNFSGSGTSYTATFTPTATSTANGVVSVASTKFTNAAGNANADGADANNTVTMTVDTIVPTIAISSDKATLMAGETATLTFTLSETATDFVAGDVTVSGGTLTNFAGSGTSYTATFTPTATSTANGVVSVASSKFTNAAGNANTDGADANNTVTMTVDTILPTLAISSNKTTLTAGETATITFTLSEAVTDFVAGDVAVAGGTLSNFTGSGASYSATFTPTANSTVSGVISVASTKFTDAAGNANADGADADNTVTMTVDTNAPTIAIASDKTALKVGETATITFTLSEPSTTFVAGDVTVSGGTLTNFAGSGSSYTATFTPAATSTANCVISVASTKFTNAGGNNNVDGADADNSVTMTVDTVLPTIAISSDKTTLGAGETAAITFVLSEAATDFVAGDVAVTGGTLSNFTGSGASYSATFTPTANSTLSGVIGVASTKFTDAAGNANADGADADNTVTMTVDTAPPAIAITSDKTNLMAGETATITFTLSETATDFVAGDVTSSGGTLTNFAGSGTTYTATFTPTAGSSTNGVVGVGSTKFTDAAGNANADGADADNTVTMTVNTNAPTIAIGSDMAALKAGETATITFTLSETSTTFIAGDVTVSGGTLTNFAGSGTSYTATFTPTAASTVNGVVSVASNKFTNAAGNNNQDGTDADNTVTMTVDTALPTIAIASSAANLGDGQTATVTFTLSESVADFVLADVVASGGILSNFSGSGASYTATFTPTANSTTPGVISVASNKFTDAAGNANTDGADANNTVSLTINTIPVVVPPVVVPPVVVPPVVEPPVVTPPVVTPPVVDPPVVTPPVVTPPVVDPPVVTPPVVTPPVVEPPVVVPPVVDPATPVSGTVDGVSVITQQQLDPATGLTTQATTVPIITSTRADDPNTANATLADIPLNVKPAAGQSGTTLVASLPLGTGLQVDGATTLLTNEQALLDLIRRIENKTVPGTVVQEEMKGNGSDFLANLSPEVRLESKTITLSAAQGATSGQPILITGSSTSPAPGQHNSTAIGLVIDTTALPGNSTILLNNVDFAAIVGAVTLRGGDGQNYVVGDSASQNILLGADDDKLYGGAGNDVIGSAGGNDVLDGGTGDDAVVGGIGNDMLYGDAGTDVLAGGRSDVGQWQFTLGLNRQISASHETQLFAPGQREQLAAAEFDRTHADLAFMNAAPQKLTELALLFHAAFGRALYVDGLNFWLSHDSSLASVAQSILTSAEWRISGKDGLTDQAFLTALYRTAFDRTPEAAAQKNWLAAMAGSADTPALSRADVLVAFALSDENRNIHIGSKGIVIVQDTVKQESGWIAGSGDDHLEGGAGSDILVGGDGIDTVVYSGKLSGYHFLMGSDGKFKVSDRANSDIDQIGGIEKAEFSDGTISLAFLQAAQPALRTLGLLYQTVLDRPAALSGLTWWLGHQDDMAHWAQGFAATAEFKARYDGMDNAAFVRALYANSSLAETAAGGSRAWVDYLGSHTRAELIGVWISQDDVVHAQFGTQGLMLL